MGNRLSLRSRGTCPPIPRSHLARRAFAERQQPGGLHLAAAASPVAASPAAVRTSVARIFPVGRRRWRVRRSTTGEQEHDGYRCEPPIQAHRSAIGSIRLGSSFLTLPTRVLTGKRIISPVNRPQKSISRRFIYRTLQQSYNKNFRPVILTQVIRSAI
jgi:hypothetical protein